jgi:transposase
MTQDIMVLADWLSQEEVTHVAMESTGVYWKPIYNILEGRFNILLVNARHIKNVPGRKTDVKDCQWIAHLLQSGLLKGSFIPDRTQRELRDLTRHRTKLVDQRASVVNRVHKVLEDANIKLGAVATDVMGKSGKDMIRALIEGEKDSAEMADLARRQLRGKIPQLRLALEGHVTDHHRFMLGQFDGSARLSGQADRSV